MAETITKNNAYDLQNIGVDYAIYGDTERGEMAYKSPTEVSRESLEKIEHRRARLGRLALNNLAA